MNHGHDGTVDHPGSEQHGEAKSAQREIARTHDEGSEKPADSLRPSGESAEESLIAEEVKELQEFIAVQEYQGMLPIPQHFNAYDESAQKVMLEIARMQAKAVYEDESKRQDKLADAEIKQGNRGQVLSASIIALDVVAAAVVAILTQNFGLASAMLALPIITVVGNLFKPTKSKSSRGQNKQG